MDNSKTDNALQSALDTQVDQHMNGNNTSELGRGSRLASWLLVLGAGPLLALDTAARSSQETGGQAAEQQGPPAPEPPILQLPGEGASDAQQELIDLFHSVERKRNHVDLQLSQAGAGVIPLEAPADSGLDDLLRGAMSASEELSGEIDRMLAIAQEMGSMQQQQGQGQGQGQPKEGQGQPGDSPLNNGSQGEQQGREDTPEGPQDGGHQPGEQQGQEEGEDEGQDKPGGDHEGETDQPDPQGQDLNGDGDNPEDGDNLAGDNPDGQAGAASTPGADAQRWGELPVRVREVFRNQGREDMPVEYRDWIDAYYRRLNKGDR